MTREDIIRMARESWLEPSSGLVPYLERFAALVIGHVAHERDAEVYHHGETSHQLREALARVKRLEDALRSQDFVCKEGLQGCEKPMGGLCNCMYAAQGDKT